jgi:hypothetical protein
LASGIVLAPIFWQQYTDQIFTNIPKCFCYLHDILSTGSIDEEHLQILDTVSSKLAEGGLTVSKEKYTFLNESVEY